MSDSLKLDELHDRIAQLQQDLESRQSRLNQFQQLVENTGEAFWIASPQSHDDLSFVSPAFETLAGRTCQSLCDGTHAWTNIIHPHDRERIGQEFCANAAKGEFNVEYRMVREDGAVLWIHDRGFPVRNQAGEVERIVGIATDITSFKLAEHERDRFFELSLDFLCTATMDGFFKQINPVFSKTLGYSDEELLGKPFLEFVHPDDQDSTLAAMESLSAGDDVLRFANRYLCKDGSVRWLAWKTPAPRPGDSLLYAVARDITEEKAAQQALIESEARYRELFENANDLIMTVDLAGNLTALNKAGEELTGYSRSELIDADLSALLSTGQADKMRWVNQRMIATRQPAHYELQITSKNGKRVPVDINTRLIYKKDRPVAVQVIARDITQRKLYEQQLTAAKDAAEAANQAKSEFLANMSHEIRTPMNAVIGLTELLLDSQLDDVQREYLQTVLTSADGLMSIINEVLDFSKIESGTIELASDVFDLREVVGDTLRTLALRAHNKGLELAGRVAPDIPSSLTGDAARVRQLILNLAGNAIKFTAAGEVMLDVVCLSRSAERIKLQFSVSDTGIGIPEDKRRNVFEAFEQVDSSTTRQFGGTGLGLAISQRIVERMGGRIWVDSQLGKGSTFHFTADFGIGKPQPETPLDAASALDKLHVLVVDDNDTSRAILAEMLANWGIHARTASSAAQAWDLLQRQWASPERVSLLVIDLTRPDVEGFDLVHGIREDDRFADLKVIVLNSSGEQDRLTAEVDEYLRLLKPVKQSEMFDAILQTMDLAPLLAGDGPLIEEEGPSRPLRILLAEDGLANQQLAIGLLQRWGHQVVVANNGREAIEQFQSQSFDLILMDVQMPETDGLTATRRIRDLERTSGGHIPIVAMTAHAMAGDREKCHDSGMDGYVSKPIRKRVLYEALAPHVTQDLSVSSRPQVKPDADQVPLELTMPSDDSPVLDWNEALRQVGGDRELLVAVSAAALEEIPTRLASLQAALDSNDREVIQRESHTIKGAVRIFGPTNVGVIAREIEAADGASPKVRELCTSLAQEIDRLLPVLAACQQQVGESDVE